MSDKRRFRMESINSDVYKSIYTEQGPLKGLIASEVFLLAIVKGYGKERLPIDSAYFFVKPEDFIDDLIPIVNAIAIKEENDNPKVLNEDKAFIYKIAEEYANTGIHILKDEYDEKGDSLLTDWYNEIVDLVEVKDIINRINSL